MMSRKKFVAALFGLAMLGGASSSAHAISFSFSQTDFQFGGSVAGTFSGEDVNGDGFLFNNELSEFTLNFSGDLLVGPFTLGLGELFALSFDLGDGDDIFGNGDNDQLSLLGDSNIGYSADQFGSPFCSAVLCTNVTGPGNGFPGFFASRSDSFILLTSLDPEPAPVAVVRAEVPEPSGLAVLGLGLGALALRRRRRRTATV